MTYEDSKADRLGENSDHVYNDWDGVEELTNLPDEAFHRNVDKIVLEAGTKNGDSVKTALLCPPTIYGKRTCYSWTGRTRTLTMRRQGEGTLQYPQQTSIRTRQGSPHREIHPYHRCRQSALEPSPRSRFGRCLQAAC